MSADVVSSLSDGTGGDDPKKLGDPEDTSLDKVLNPFSKPILINDGVSQTVPSLDSLLAKLDSLPTPTCGPGFTSGTDCEEETVQTYTGSVELSIAPGDILAINGSGGVPLKVLVTEGGANGKGLLYYNAFGGVTIPVNFVGVKAWEAPNGNGGCVYAGEMPVSGSDNSVLDKDVQSQVLALYGKINDPDSFSGIFDKALEELKNKATELKDQATINSEDWTQLNTYIVASKTGFSGWQTDINNAFGSDVPEEVQTALTRLGEIEEELAELSSCASDNIPEDGGGDSYRNLTALLRLACSMEFDKLIAKQEEAREVHQQLFIHTKWPEIESYLADNTFDYGVPPTVDCSQTNRTGNINFNGTAEHWLIQWDYIERTAGGVREFKIPYSSGSGRTGYCDLGNVLFGELFEIKPVTQIANGSAEIEVYVNMARKHCDCAIAPPLQWHKGTNYTQRILPHPRNPNMELEVTLGEPGLIVYRPRSRTTPSPQPIPIAIPQNLVDKLVNLLRNAGNNINQMERDLALYLQQHPDARIALKAAGYTAVTAFVVYIIANDATLVGILDDVAGLRVAWSMYMILNKL